MDVPHLRQLRRQAVLSQQQLAQKSGVAQDTISKLETGQRRAYPKTIHKLAASLEVEPQELILDREVDQQEPVESPARGEDRPEKGSKKKLGF